MAAAAVMLAAAVAHAGSAAGGGQQRPLVSAFYFGDWHVDPQMSALHGAGWTEFDIVPHARPRFPGHLQPNIPLEDAARGFGVNVSEALPEVMAKKIEAATSHGVGSKSSNGLPQWASDVRGRCCQQCSSLTGTGTHRPRWAASPTCRGRAAAPSSRARWRRDS